MTEEEKPLIDQLVEQLRRIADALEQILTVIKPPEQEEKKPG